MNEIIINNEKFLYIDKYECSFGEFYKFSNMQKTIYCQKENEKFIEIKNRKFLKEINKKIKEYQIKDVV